MYFRVVLHASSGASAKIARESSLEPITLAGGVGDHFRKETSCKPHHSEDGSHLQAQIYG